MFGSHPLVRTYLHFQTRTFWLIPIVNWAIRRSVYGGWSLFFLFLSIAWHTKHFVNFCVINALQYFMLVCVKSTSKREIEKKFVACEWEGEKNARNQSYNKLFTLHLMKLLSSTRDIPAKSFSPCQSGIYYTETDLLHATLVFERFNCWRRIGAIFLLPFSKTIFFWCDFGRCFL